MAKNKTISSAPDDWQRSVDFRFGETTGLTPPDGFDELSVEDEVTVTVTGKVTALREDENGAGLTLKMTKVELQAAPEKDEPDADDRGSGISAALAKAKKKKS